MYGRSTISPAGDLMVTVCWKKYCTTPACKQICVNYIFICHVMSCHAMSHHHAMLSHHDMSCHITSYHVMPSYATTQCHAMFSGDVIPCMQCHAMPSYPVMQLFISHNPTSNLCALIGQNTSCGTCTISLISHNLKIQYDGVFTRPILPHEGVCLQINFY